MGYDELMRTIPDGVKLVVVSKQRSVQEIQNIYNKGHRVFGENRVAELINKKDALPGDIEWHFIGNLQSKSVKPIIPFVSLIHSVDRVSILQAINKLAISAGVVVNVLLQVKISPDENKNGFSVRELLEICADRSVDGIGGLTNIAIRGIMAVATNTDNKKKIEQEFDAVVAIFKSIKLLDIYKSLDILSIGMSSDYTIAIEKGSNMVRIGTAIFQ